MDINMKMYLFIFTTFMVDGDFLHKQRSYFSFSSELECRAVELITMGKNDQQNCKVRFTPYPNNQAEEISKGLASRVDI